MRWALSMLWFWTALVLIAALASCEDSSKPEASSAPPPSATTLRLHRAEYQRTLVNLSADVARWKADLQSIDPGKLCRDRAAAAALKVGLITAGNDLNALQSRIPSLAQRETLAGNIELSTALQEISADTTRLETLLGCTPTGTGAKSGTAAAEISVAAGKIQKCRQELVERMAKIQALSMTAVQTPALLPGEEPARASLKDVAEVVKALAWPLAVAVLLLLFRRPLSRFMEQIAGKITKVSVFEVSLELATVPSAPTPWLDPQVWAGTELFGGAVTTTTIMTLFERIRDDTVWEYLIVDLKDGRSWLESRLYLFTALLQQMGGLRCVIFVRSTESEYQRFIGMARPEDVRSALEKKYLWFRPILNQSFCAAALAAIVDTRPPDPHRPPLDPVSLLQELRNRALSPPPLNDFNAFFVRIDDMFQRCQAMFQRMPKDVAKEVAERFIFDARMQSPTDPTNPEWSKLTPNGPWDHSQWLTVERFNADLRDGLFDPNLSQLEDTPDKSDADRMQALLRRPVPFVALVNQKGEFQRLVDRKVLVEQVAAQLGAESTKSPAKAVKGGTDL